MTLVAQLTDVHLLERPGSSGDTGEVGTSRSKSSIAKLLFLSSYRPLSAEKRIERARRALEACRRARPDHLIVTGDLTEHGSPGQWAVAAELFHESGIDPSRITFVPGNHDVYGGKRALADAFAGPLAAFRSAHAGEPLDFGDARIVPLDTTIEQHWVRAAARIGSDTLARLDRLAGDGKPTMVVTHHPPLPHALPGLAWFQELEDLPTMGAFLARNRNVFVAHGHVHRHHEHVLGHESAPRVFSAAAVVEHPAPLRLYELDRRGVRARL